MILTNNTYRLCVGTYASKGEPGIFVYDFDPEHQKFTFIDRANEVDRPSFLALDADGRKLYAVSEIAEYVGELGGSVAAYSINEHGKLHYLNERPSLGEWPCHLIVHPNHKLLLFTNYLGGSTGMFSLHEDGSLNKITDKVQHVGGGRGGARADRQRQAHPHSIFLDQANRFAVVPDLGTDTIMIYKIDVDHEKFIYHDKVPLQQSAGPRHFAFHPSNRFAYSINELDSTITAFSYDSLAGKLEILQTISTWPTDYHGASDCADIHIDPTGQFLYGSNRGHDSISIFKINPTNGYLTWVDCTRTQGKTPRNFAISPDGQFLFAANQDSDSIVVFKRNADTGKLVPTGAVLQLYKPVCILIK
jgi:6-phosphogluconolactonase